MKTLPMKRNTLPIRCKVQVVTQDGHTHIYQGLFKSTSEAVIDAMEKFEVATVIARASCQKQAELI